MPKDKCGQIVDFDQITFDGQIHTAGFVDPNFNGRIVLEIRTLSEINFNINEPIGFMDIYDMCEIPEKLYFSKHNNYQNQTLGLPKQFIKIKE